MEKIVEGLRKMREEGIKNLKSKKGGSELIIFIVIVAVVAALAFKTLPGMMTKVNSQGQGAVTKIEDLNKIFD